MEALNMRGDITMSIKEVGQIEIFEKLVRREIKQKRAATALGLSVRQVKRKLERYKLEGAKSLVHKAKGRVSNRKVNQKILDEAMDEIREKYHDFGPTLAHEKLVENHSFSGSLSLVRQEMIKEKIWKPKKRRKAHVHQLRERRACFGELLQLDGSPHDWFEGRNERCNLNVGIDDATGKAMFWFSSTETTQDYFELLEKYFAKYGLPLAIYVDRNSIFKINNPGNLEFKKPSSDSRFEGLTQFSRAMKELGVELIFANTPQAKGRVERVNSTLQDRLVKEMRLKNISNIKEANQFMLTFTKKFNQKFGAKPKSKVDIHRKIFKEIDLTRILCVKETRLLSKNLTFQYNNTIFQIQTKRSAYTMRKTRITICERYDGSVAVRDNKDRSLKYTCIQKVAKQKTTSSKELNNLVDAILGKQKKNPWESDPADFEQENLFYKPVRAV
jgi:transposase